MRSTDHRAVIIDLGNVALPEDPPTDQVLQTTGGGIVLPFVPFTPGFVAPEHRDGTCVIDGRGDQFSLGVLLYLWCSGKDAEGCLWPYNPDTGYANNPADPHRPIPLVELRASFLEDWPPLLRTSYAAFSHIVQRMLSRRREDRYSSLRDVAAEIQMILALHNPGAVAPLATAELQMDGSFLETCRQVSVAPSEEAGCLILQTLVRQGRQQIEQTIGRIWSDLFEIWFDSQWSFDQKLRRMLDEGRKLETVFHTSLNTVLRTFQATRLAGSAAPRFGGRLQQILGRPGSAPMPPRSVTGYDAKTVQERIDEQWNYFSRRQEELAEIDYLLALYSLQLRTTRTST